MLLLFSNGMVQITLAFMYLFKKKTKKGWTRLTTPSPLAHGFYHLTFHDIPNLCWYTCNQRFEKMARDEKNMNVLLNTNSVLEKQPSWLCSIFKECILWNEKFERIWGFCAWEKFHLFQYKPFSHFCNGKRHPQTPKASDHTTVHVIRFWESERVWSGTGTKSLTEIIKFLSRIGKITVKIWEQNL